MIEEFQWLLRKEEIEFEKKKFKGILAGKAYKYSRNIDGLIRTRILIFAMSLIVFYPVLTNYLFHEYLDIQFFIERIVFCAILVTSGLLFNKYRVLSIILAVIPVLIISSTYLIYPGTFHIRTGAFMLAIAMVILIGIYHDFQCKKIKRELEAAVNENT